MVTNLDIIAGNYGQVPTSTHLSTKKHIVLRWQFSKACASNAPKMTPRLMPDNPSVGGTFGCRLYDTELCCDVVGTYVEM